ncbi:hypothetical protein CUZ56_02672 [Saezia sanguinis]|uniref:Bacteriophage CI repressor n=1 Tax=Saezia sanguinis TaxID=1965230 RepID=A0A433SAQ3_9BURK|nr:hypothetical protein CUZ56_02672 [Saezia sanguinis]
MPVNDFDQILLRLKAQLDVASNKKVAELLGMSYGAFNARSQRKSFPEEKLRILSEKRPELNLDIEYILNGAPARTGKTPWTPAVNTATPHTVQENSVSHSLGNAASNPETFAAKRREAARQIDAILDKIGFTAAHTLLRNTMAELLQHGQITVDAAETLLTIAHDDHEFYQKQGQAQGQEQEHAHKAGLSKNKK